MSYQPTLFLPIELVERINSVILPLENSIRHLAAQPVINVSARQTAIHNLKCLANFKHQQQSVIEDYIHKQKLLQLT